MVQDQSGPAPVVGHIGDPRSARGRHRAETSRPSGDQNGAVPASLGAEAIEGRKELGAPDPHQAREADDLSLMHCQRDILRRLEAGPFDVGLEARVLEPQDLAANPLRTGREQILEGAADQHADQFGLRGVRLGLAHYGAVPHHRHPGGNARHLLQAMRNVDDPDAPPAQLPHHAEQMLGFRGREGRCRFVHDQDARLGRQRLGDGDELAFTEAQGGYRQACVERHASLPQQLARLAQHAALVQSGIGGAAFAAEEQVGRNVEPGDEIEFLRDHDHPRRMRLARVGEADRLPG
jgi:hypothetical protein